MNNPNATAIDLYQHTENGYGLSASSAVTDAVHLRIDSPTDDEQWNYIAGCSDNGDVALIDVSFCLDKKDIQGFILFLQKLEAQMV